MFEEQTEIQEESPKRICKCEYCNNQFCAKKIAKRKKSAKNGDNGNKNENYGESLFETAVKILIKEGKFDDCYHNPILDEYGIDFVLIKFIILKNKKIRIALHIQVKQGENGIKKHFNRYPHIPAILINPNSPIEKIKKEILALFLKNFETTCFHAYLILDFEKTLRR